MQIENRKINNTVTISNIKQIKTIKENIDIGILYINLLLDGRLDSCSQYGTLKILDISNNYHCDITLPHERVPVTYFYQEDKHKITSSNIF